MIPSCYIDHLQLWEPNGSIMSAAREFNCSPFLASLLWMRGIEAGSPPSELRKWVSPDLDYWLDAVDLGTESAKARRLWSEVSEGSNVVVYGDYDVDGIAATTFVMELALIRGARVRYYIPHRYNQGYGFHPNVVNAIVKSKVRCDMLVVVDCGTQNIEAAEVARSAGIPVIIFDHHLARGELAAAGALVNPHVEGSELARGLCATGVVWAWAWKNELAPREWLLRNLDLAALATIADCVPMSSPVNRAIVRQGVQSIRKDTRPGLLALMKGMAIDISSLDSDALAMRVIPCLNAAGRLQIADHAMKVFFPSDHMEEDAQKLIDLNIKRRDLSAKIVGDVERGAGANAGYHHVLYGDDWPAGVLSSVASHVCCMKDAPVVLAAPAQEAVVRGTLRVPQGVDAEAILSSISHDLLSWGGHRMAAGFSVERKKWQQVRDELEAILSGTQRLAEKEDILSWSPAELDLASWKDAERMGPFGVGNPYPRLFCSHEGGVNAEKLGRKGNHVKIYVDGCQLLGFSGDNLLRSDLAPTGWVYKPRINFWRSSENLQLVLEKVVVDAA